MVPLFLRECINLIVLVLNYCRCINLIICIVYLKTIIYLIVKEN
jgi:hypothetical protein